MSARPVLAQGSRGSEEPPSGRAPAGPHGELHGTVRDEGGHPLPGAVVSALGVTSAYAVSDDDGRFTFRRLPAGPYLVRVHLRGFLPGRGQIVQINAGARETWATALVRRAGPNGPPTRLAAGVGAAETTAEPIVEDDAHGHDEVAWRLRHLKRSVLKADEFGHPFDSDDSMIESSFTGIGRAVGSSARLASSLFADLPLTGQLNLLTSTSFDRPQDLFSETNAPNGVAYLALRAPTPAGEWRMRGTVTQGDLASWMLAGSYVARPASSHRYEAGLSYSMQRYLGGNAEALAALRDGSRNVGSVYAYDTFDVVPRVQVTYGAKYAHYDYLAVPGLLSPRAGVAVQPLAHDTLKVRASFSHRETAPGAEEFLPPSAGLWLPPERTFSSLSRDHFRPQRVDHVEIGAERTWAGDVVVGARVFRQLVQDQVVTLFGVTATGSAGDGVGHYHIASAGNVEARGWSVSVSQTVGPGVRASLDYTQVESDWIGGSPNLEALARVAASVLRGEERTHDLTATIQSELAATATRVYVLYKLNTAFADAGVPAAATVTGARFDVQVNQPLPALNFTNARWEILVAVRNVFHEEQLESSVYDELFVVRPPTRVLGGVTVRF